MVEVILKFSGWAWPALLAVVTALVVLGVPRSRRRYRVSALIVALLLVGCAIWWFGESVTSYHYMRDHYRLPVVFSLGFVVGAALLIYESIALRVYGRITHKSTDA